MREAVGVYVGGDGLRMSARLARHHDRVGNVWRGLGGVGEFLRELAEHEVLAAPLDEPERSDVPEHGRTAVAEHDFPAIGQREQLAQARAHRTHEVLDGRLTMRSAHEAPAFTGEGIELCIAHLRWAAAEATVARQ